MTIHGETCLVTIVRSHSTRTIQSCAPHITSPACTTHRGHTSLHACLLATPQTPSMAPHCYQYVVQILQTSYQLPPYLTQYIFQSGLPRWLSGKESACQ